jgi:hypothetical protein
MFLSTTHKLKTTYVHAKASQIGSKRNLRVVFSFLAWLDYRFGTVGHVVIEVLAVCLSVLHVTSFNPEVGGKNVSKLCTIPVSTTSDCGLQRSKRCMLKMKHFYAGYPSATLTFLFVIIIVTGGQKVPKNQFRDVHLMLFVHDYRNTISIIPNRDSVGRRVNVDFKSIH